jgi:hypothetical protein
VVGVVGVLVVVAAVETPFWPEQSHSEATTAETSCELRVALTNNNGLLLLFVSSRA